MRIGTWNLAGRWDHRREKLLSDQCCDIWLLTEVSRRLALDDYAVHVTAGRMADGQHWAAVLARHPVVPRPDPHPASALAEVAGMSVCSSILPWRGSGGQSPWVGARHADRTRAALDQLMLALPVTGLVWGGDWNHALSGRECAGSLAGRAQLLDIIGRLGLKVPTADLPHQLPGLLTIDHVAVAQDVVVTAAARIVASIDGRRLSDHDVYWIDVM